MTVIFPSQPAPEATADPAEPGRARVVNPSRRGGLWAVGIAAVFFAAVAPTLSWQQFSGGSENLVVETVLEMHRGGPRFIPTLMGIPRVTKPPLTAWLTAAAVRPETVAQLTTREQAARDAAFERLAWQVRWPSLLSSCAMLVATYALAVNAGLGARVGLVAMAACGSTLMFQRFGRAATTDVQLALWVTAANAFLALAILRRRPWLGYVGAGVALGLAFMSKGPVAFVQTLVPFAAFVAWRLFAARRPLGPRAPAPPRGFDPILPGRESSAHRANSGAAVDANAGVDVMSAAEPASAPRPLPARRSRAWPAGLAGLFVMLAVGLPWYAYVLHGHPPIVEAWKIEVTREGATQLPPDPWYMYGAFFLWTVPWLAWFLAGLWVGGLAVARATPPRPSDGLDSPNEKVTREGPVLAFLLFVVPVVLMSFFRDKPERYLLPVLPPAALVAARAAVAWWQSARRDPGGGVVDAAHWVTLLVLAVGLPVAGLLMPRLGFGERWFSPASAVAWGLAGAAVVGLGLALRGRLGWTVATTAATAALILLLQFPVIRNYSRMDRPDLKPLADVVWERHPDAAVYEYEPAGRTRVRMDLPIYLGRLTKKTDDPVALRPSDCPQVVVFFQRHAPQAPALPDSWQPLATGGNRKEAWRAYVLPPVPRQ